MIQRTLTQAALLVSILVSATTVFATTAPTPSPTPNPIAPGYGRLVKLNARSARVAINLPEDQALPSCAYVDTTGLNEFVELMKNDRRSLIGRVTARLNRENQASTSDCEGMMCGEVTFSDGAQVTYARAGGSEAYAVYRVFIRFTDGGSMHDTSSVYSVDISVDAHDAGELPNTGTVKVFTILGGRNVSHDALTLH